ncbi:MAG: hypothetical protein ACYDCO_06530 [Armatimonadota bacterium]
MLPLNRTAYQTNERIDLAVTRSDARALEAGDLVLRVTGMLGDVMTFTFPVRGGSLRAMEHLHLNGWLLRPGVYTVEVSVDGASAQKTIEVYSHLRKSSFKLIDWGSRAEDRSNVLGEDSLGFNLLYAPGFGDASIRGGLDYMGACVVGGGHQVDLRMDADWSDPYVIGGVKGRAARQALRFRNTPNAVGVHLFDEPGLTWWENPKTGEFGPHDIPSQVRSYKSAFDKAPIASDEVDSTKPEDIARWEHWATWKLSFMDAAWKDALFGVTQVRPDYLTVTQSQYGWVAYVDGYYFNVTRSLPVASGHGGYDNIGPGYFCPSWFLEMARARDLSRPCWYLPTWFGETNELSYRLEQYLSFMAGIQGLAKPPEMLAHNPQNTKQADYIVETNRTMARLGTIFTTMQPERPKVAMLYSLSHLLRWQAMDREKNNYASSGPHGQGTIYVYLAGKMLQTPVQPIVEEDVKDGTLQAEHKVLIIPSVTYLEPAVVKSLEQFIAHGGMVLLTGDCTVQIKGAINLGVTPHMQDQEKIDEAAKEGKWEIYNILTSVGNHLKATEPLAKALKPYLAKAGIAPAFGCDNVGIAATRQASGDVEYLFAANASYDWKKGERNSLAPAVANITLPNDGRPVYDAVNGGEEKAFAAKGSVLSAQFRFGPGQLRAFARTARPIGGVRVGTPVVQRDYTAPQAPVRLRVATSVIDASGRVLAGAIPLKVKVYDALGTLRYEFLRATENGTLTLNIPLAANDPAGNWAVSVTELLSNLYDTMRFTYEPPAQCGTIAGMTSRGVIFDGDRERIFRFFRTHKAVTIVTGTGDYNELAAQRLAAILKPWDVRSTIISAQDANRARELSEEEAATWCGTDYRTSGEIKPGRDNPPQLVGYDVATPVILLGTPEDNPLIENLVKQQVLPYALNGNFPGAGRGLLAWQTEIIGKGLESIALIAYDADGMAEAVGTLYEIAAGMDPLTLLVLPTANTIVPASKRQPIPPTAANHWKVSLPDRAVSLQLDGGLVKAYSLDNSLTGIDPSTGKVLASVPVDILPEAVKPVTDTSKLPKDRLLPNRIVKLTAAGNGLTAVAYWGGALQTFDTAGTLKTEQMLPQDVSAMLWIGNTLVVATADGKVLGLVVK